MYVVGACSFPVIAENAGSYGVFNEAQRSLFYVANFKGI